VELYPSKGAESDHAGAADRDKCRDCSFELRRIGVLLEFHDLAVAKREEVSELCSHSLTVLLVGSTVVSVSNRGVAGIKHSFGRNCKALPARYDASKNAVQHGSWSQVRIPSS
jgi:hypothetical protein